MEINHTNINEINELPSFGSSAKFSAILDSTNFGDNWSSRSIKGINGLNMTLDLNFNELTDLQSQNLISFFQSQFYYETQNYSNDGSFSNKRLTPFDYQPFYPYKKNKFTCLNFNHNKSYHNVNSVSASLNCIGASTLSSVEPNHFDFQNLSATYDFRFFDFSGLKFTTLTNTSESNTIYLNQYSHLYFPNSYVNYRVLSFPHIIPPEDTQIIVVEGEENLSESDSFSGITYNTQLRNSIYIDKPNDCAFYPYSPKCHFQGGIDLETSLEQRVFDFRPSNVFSLSHSPKHKQSTVNDFYKKYSKYGLNPSLNNITLEFNMRKNIEAKKILLFLESHLGYKKFAFNFQKDYNNFNYAPSNATSLNKVAPTFFCPEWNHTVVYKDNHTISATFIECL